MTFALSCIAVMLYLNFLELRTIEQTLRELIKQR